MENAGLQELEFPRDHYTHDSRLEWWYLWGKLDSVSYHCATFRFRLGQTYRTTHWSLHSKESEYFEDTKNEMDGLKTELLYINNRFTLSTEEFDLVAIPNSKPVEHKVEGRRYYSIPHLSTTMFLKRENRWVEGESWLDHEFGDDISRLEKNWDWLSMKLDNGVCITMYKLEEKDIYCSVALNSKLLITNGSLDNLFACVPELGMSFELVPTTEERVFHPKFGKKYSEQPQEIWHKGEVIGYGMRERTHSGRN